MRNHAQFTELFVNHHIFYHQQTHGYDNAKSHGTNHQYRIHSTDDAHLNVVVNHVIYKVDDRNSRHNEQCTSQQRMIGSCGKSGKGGEVGKESRD